MGFVGSGEGYRVFLLRSCVTDLCDLMSVDGEEAEAEAEAGVVNNK